MAEPKKQEPKGIDDPKPEGGASPSGNTDDLNKDPKSPVTNPSPSNGDDIRITKMEQDIKALSGVVSGKDKKLGELEGELSKVKNEAAVKDLLLEAELPTAVKSALKSRMGSLTPENFEAEAQVLTDIYNSGKEAKADEVKNVVGKKPSETEAKPVVDKVLGAKTEKELLEALEEGGTMSME